MFTSYHTPRDIGIILATEEHGAIATTLAYGVRICGRHCHERHRAYVMVEAVKYHGHYYIYYHVYYTKTARREI